jgi:hypothetical protein
MKVDRNVLSPFALVTANQYKSDSWKIKNATTQQRINFHLNLNKVLNVIATRVEAFLETDEHIQNTLITLREEHKIAALFLCTLMKQQARKRSSMLLTCKAAASQSTPHHAAVPFNVGQIRFGDLFACTI